MSVPLKYDAAGNLIDDGMWGFSYDAENRLTDASRTVPDLKVAKYKYDGLDRRTTKTVDLSVRTDYLWAGQNIMAEYKVPSIAAPATQYVQRRYLFGPGVDEPIAMLQYNEAATPVLTDIQYYHAGTVVAMSGGLVGQPNYGKLRDSYKYSAHGEANPSTSGNIFRYTGRQLDPETGLYYYRARYYNPALGRFLQTDPVGDADSMNLYQYALWNPISNRDPMGTQAATLSDIETIIVTASSSNNANGVSDNFYNSLTQIFAYHPPSASLLQRDVMSESLIDLGFASIPGAVGGVTRFSRAALNARIAIPKRFARVTPERRVHILDGDKTGGGHRPGRGLSGKSEFPGGMSDDEVITLVEDVANDPSSSSTGGHGGRTVVEGTRNGVDIKVIIEPNGNIVTAYPTNVPRNP